MSEGGRVGGRAIAQRPLPSSPSSPPPIACTSIHATRSQAARTAAGTPPPSFRARLAGGPIPPLPSTLPLSPNKPKALPYRHHHARTLGADRHLGQGRGAGPDGGPGAAGRRRSAPKLGARRAVAPPAPAVAAAAAARGLAARREAAPAAAPVGGGAGGGGGASSVIAKRKNRKGCGDGERERTRAWQEGGNACFLSRRPCGGEGKPGGAGG